MKNPIAWEPEYSVGVGEIDGHHKNFLGILNELYLAIYSGKEIEWMGYIFDQVDGYIKFHFAFEERYFEEFKYQYKDLHILKHKEFIDKIEGMKTDFHEHKKDITEEMVRFLEEWFIQHINNVDKMYTKTFHNHGLF